MKKEEFRSKAHSVLDQVVNRINEMELKAGEVAEDAKEEYRKQLDNLKDIKDNLSAKLDEFDKVADSKWDVVKESAGSFFASVSDAWKENYGKVADAFKKTADKVEDVLDGDKEEEKQA